MKLRTLLLLPLVVIALPLLLLWDVFGTPTWGKREKSTGVKAA